MHAKLIMPLILALLSGCAEKPNDKIAHGEDHNLIAKADLLGRPLAEVSAAEKVETGVPTIKGALSSAVAPLAAKLEGGSDTALVFDVTESYVTLSKVEAGTAKPVLQFAVKGHYDLKNKADDEGVESQYLVKDDTANLRWQDRAYVEVDPASPLLIKADADTLQDLYLVENLKDQDFVFNGAADLKWLTPDDAAEVVKTFGLKPGQKMRTTLSRRFLTILALDAKGQVQIVAQAPVSYFDLVRMENDKEDPTPKLVRDQKVADWSARSYVAVAKDSAVIAKPTAQLMEFLHDKASLKGAVKLGDPKAPLLSQTVDLKGLLATSAIPVSLSDEVTYKVTEGAVYVMKGGDVILKYAVLAHVDVAPKINDFGEVTAVLEHNQTNRAWAARQYVMVDARDAEVALLANNLKDIKGELIARADVKGQCFELAKLPIQTIVPAIQAEMKEGEDNALVCLEVSQTVVSVFLNVKGKRRLILTYDVYANFDIGQATSPDGKNIDSVLTPNTSNPRWDQRAYVAILTTNPQPVKDMVAPNALTKGALAGEFVYTSVVTAAHSENGLVFTGWTSQSPDRLLFEAKADTVTLYKVHDPASNSSAKTPVMRFPVSHFDVQRAKNGFGDETNVLEENTEKPWAQRKNVRIDFASNQIAEYTEDMLSLASIYGLYFRSSSVLVGEVHVDDETISFETEEVMTPNMLSDYLGNVESLQPVSVRVRHTFLKVGGRGYTAKEYSAIDFAKFGYFETTEAGVDPILGKTDDTLKHFIRRFDVSNGKHIDYTLSPNFPEKYKPVARKVIDAWNVAFKAATGRDGVISLDESGTRDAFDPRHSTIVYVDQRHDQEPLGYGPSVFDPATGENISGKAYVYDSSIQLVMGMASDYYDLVTGARTVDDFATAGSMRGADLRGANSGRLVQVTPLSQALPKTKTEALRFKQATPVPFKLSDSLAKLKSNASLAPAAHKAEATKAFAEISTAHLAKLARAHRPSAAERLQGCEMDPEAHVVSAMRFVAAHEGLSKAEVMAKLEESMMFSLMLHEVGHTLGLRHNFQGSFDEQGFPAEYFKAKAENGWTEQYRTSSTMDYLDDFEATSLAAGPYDVAAIKFGYGDKLEVVTGQDEFGAVITEDMPKAIFDDAVAEVTAANPGASANAINAAVMNALGVRPYKFCSDEHVADDPTCKRFDSGITVEETTRTLISEYETRYKLYGFRRGRRDFTGSSGSVLGRYILPVRQLLDEYIYNIIFDAFPAQDNFDGSPNPGSPSDYVNALNVGIDFYEKVLGTIEPGVYHLDEATGELVSGRSDAEGAKNVVVDLETGKYLESRVEIIGGHEERILNRGIEMDKIFVLYAMSMRGYPAPKYERAQLAANYFDLLKTFTLERFSSIIREDHKVNLVTKQGADGDFHPVVGRVDAADPTVLQAKIAPSTSLAIREYATIFATSFDNNGNRTFGDYVDYRIKGVDAAFPAGVTTAEFTSASGLNTYVVADTADGLSISFEIARKAQETASKVAAAKEAMTNAPAGDELKAQAIVKFGEAWAIGNGEPMGDDIVAILEGNFDPNVPIMRLLTDQFVAGTEDPELLAKITAIRDELNAILDQYEAIASTRAELESMVQDGERALTGYETDLIHLKDMYQIFK